MIQHFRREGNDGWACQGASCKAVIHRQSGILRHSSRCTELQAIGRRTGSTAHGPAEAIVRCFGCGDDYDASIDENASFHVSHLAALLLPEANGDPRAVEKVIHLAVMLQACQLDRDAFASRYVTGAYAPAVPPVPRWHCYTGATGACRADVAADTPEEAALEAAEETGQTGEWTIIAVDKFTRYEVTVAVSSQYRITGTKNDLL